MSTVKRRSPETVGQAREWDRTKGRYLLFGLCELCAGQAAYGHQQHAGGWDAINPPCPKCAEVVAAMPIATGNPQWRKTGRFDAS